tara:strand:+ start:20764 stop:21300 length:537 start_codon:yes stop_codon:yes gene_type:complete
MQLMNSKDKYGVVTKLLHGLIALTIIAQIVLGILTQYTSKQTFMTIMMVHKSIGLILLVLAVIFIGWRIMNVKPQWPNSMPDKERFLARLTHLLMYIVLFCMPLSGWIMATASGHIPNFFNLFEAPTPFVSLNKPLAGFMSQAHEFMAWTLGVLIVLHILGALKHHFIDKNDILKRMF